MSFVDNIVPLLELGNRSKKYCGYEPQEKNIAYDVPKRILCSAIYEASQKTIEGLSFQYGYCNVEGCFFAHDYYDILIARYESQARRTLELHVARPSISPEAFEIFERLADDVLRPNKKFDILPFQDLSNELAQYELYIPGEWPLSTEAQEKDWMTKSRRLVLPSIADFKAQFDGKPSDHICDDCSSLVA